MDSNTIHDLVVNRDIGELSRLLMQVPTSVSDKNRDGDEPLHLACWEKDLEIVKMLLTAKANANAPGSCGFTPLHYAVYEGDERSVPIVRALLEYGADPNIADNKGWTSIEYAKISMEDSLPQMLGILENAIRNVPPPGFAHWPEIHRQAYNGDAEAVGHLVCQNPELVHLKDRNGNTALHVACWGKQPDVIVTLCVHNADVNAKALRQNKLSIWRCYLRG